jgi:hypothetical protein
MMKPTLADDVVQALANAQRTPGWNNRNPAIRRFEIGRYGLDCTLYVVPFRAWAYRRAERDAQAWQAQA